MSLLLKGCAVEHPVPVSRPPPVSDRAPARLVPVLAHLQYPVGVTHAGDHSRRLFIVLQTGRVLVMQAGASAAQPFLDLRDKVNCCGESGLLGVAFDPGFEHNGRFYVDYINTQGETVIARFDTGADHARALPASETVLLRIDQPTSIHNGGQLAFGPDGYLYIATGDGGSFDKGGDGSGKDPHNHAQRKDSLLGKILRIDVHGPAGGHPGYRLPPDNPFVNQSEARGEIWALGLKNPWRFSFDRATGDLYITDVGRDRWEEINFQPAGSGGGQNYGWRLMEGPACFYISHNCNDGTLTLPVAWYSHTEGCAIIGGFVYRGAAYPRLRGHYLFGDYCRGTLWTLSRVADTWQRDTLARTDLNISSFGEDEEGEVYVIGRAAEEGAVYRLALEPEP